MGLGVDFGMLLYGSYQTERHAGKDHEGAVAGAITLVTLVSVLMALNMPEYGRSITYGVIILALLLLYGREADES